VHLHLRTCNHTHAHAHCTHFSDIGRAFCLCDLDAAQLANDIDVYAMIQSEMNGYNFFGYDDIVVIEDQYTGT
jgi:hypothetical protein